MSNTKVLIVGALLWSLGAQGATAAERNIIGGVVVPFIEGLDSTIELQSTQEQLAAATSQIDEASLLLSGAAIPDASEIDALISQLFHDTVFPGSNPPPPLANQINNGLLPYLQAAIDKLSDVSHIKQIALGTNYSLMLLDNGKIYGLGGNDGGQLGVGSLDSPLLSLTLMDLSPLGAATPVALSAGSFTSYVLSSDGKVFAVGDNTNGELGIGTFGDERLTLTAMDFGPLGGAHATAIVGGVNNFLLVASDNNIYGTGINTNGELGTGYQTPILTLTKMNLTPLGVGVTPVVVSLGGGHTVVLASDGKIYGVGSNVLGQLGIGNLTSPQLTFTQMALSPLAGATPVTVAATKQSFTIVLTNNGKIYGTGINTQGQLGLGIAGLPKTSLTPMIVSPLGNALPASIAVGSSTFLVLTNDCKVYGTGQNVQGNLGVGDATRRLTLTAMNLAPLGTALPTAIVVAGSSSLVLADNGLVYGTGLNSGGQLDTGNTTRVLTLTAMRELTAVPVLTKFPIG